MTDRQPATPDTILVVDDDALQRDLIRASLEGPDLEVIEAADGAEGLALFREHAPSLVLMDIQMPVMDGFAACAAMQEAAGDDGAAVIMVTGDEDIAAVEKSFELGALEFLTKPLDWQLLRMRVLYVLRNRRMFLDLRAQRERLAWAQRAAGVGSWHIAGGSGAIAISTEAASILGFAGACEIPLERFLDLIAPGDRRGVLRAYARLLRQGEPIGIDVHLAVSARPGVIVHLHGERPAQTATLSGTLQDVTEHKRAEARIRQAAALQSQFLANMSHEMRTPIAGILGMAELLGTTTQTPDQTDWTENILESARHLQGVINEILDLAKIQAGQMHLENEVFDLQQCLEKTCGFVMTLAEDKGLDLDLQWDPALPRQVCGDEGRLRQVVLNLLGNAIKFTEHGGVTVAVEAASLPAQPARVRITVRDTGVGIPLTDQAEVFEQFRQVDGSRSRRHEGAGLGLSICRKLVELMGGRIGLTSSEGVGTEVSFTVRLPEAVPTESPPVGTTEAAAEQRGIDGMRVLVAEDNRINRAFVLRLLERLGASVDCADDGSDALALVRANSYDVVLMDCQMPLMDGYEATRRIRALEGPAAGVPIIALTAHAFAEDRARCLEAGMDAYLSKPVSAEALVRTIGGLMAAPAPSAT